MDRRIYVSSGSAASARTTRSGVTALNGINPSAHKPHKHAWQCHAAYWIIVCDSSVLGSVPRPCRPTQPCDALQVEFVEACITLDRLKPAARAVRQLGLQAEFPNIEALYRQRSLARLVGKRLWSVALSFVGSDIALQVRASTATTPLTACQLPGVEGQHSACLCSDLTLADFATAVFLLTYATSEATVSTTSCCWHTQQVSPKLPLGFYTLLADDSSS